MIGTILLYFSVCSTGYLPSGAVRETAPAENKARMVGLPADCNLGMPVKPEPGIDGKFGPLNRICSGVNIHFTAGHEADLDMIAAAGFRYIRMDLVWQETERARGIYSWADYDELTANLDKRGLRAIYILDYSNSLYEDPVESKDPLTGEKETGIAAPRHKESVTAFSRWASAAAVHFRDSRVVWEIWNEPNVTFWKPVPDVAQYITLAMATCSAMRSAVPDCVIIGPATSQIPFPFIESFLASGVLRYLDGVSVHPYRDYAKSPETAVTDYRRLRDLIDRYSPEGIKNVPIISSEWGYASATKGLSVNTQAKYIVRMQLSNLLYGIPVSIWYDWKNDGDDPGNFEHNCGTVSSDLKPKPAYITASTMNRQLDGFTFLRRMDFKNDSDYIMLFKDDRGNYKICAWTTDQPNSVISNIVVPYAAGLSALDGEGNVLKLKTDRGKLVLDLNDLPQYISLPSGLRLD